MADGPAVRTAELAAPAYIKMMLHAAKYPTTAVNGVFIGDRVGDKIVLRDAIPLFHSPLNLAAMLEVALLQIDGHCRSTGMHIVGYYQGNEHVDKFRMDSVFSSIACQINQNNSSAVGVLIENADMTIDTLRQGGGYAVFFSVGAKKWHMWRAKDTAGADDKGFVCGMTPRPAAAGQALVDLVAKGVQDELVDFDCHLDDISLDVLNPALAKHVAL